MTAQEIEYQKQINELANRVEAYRNRLDNTHDGMADYLIFWSDIAHRAVQSDDYDHAMSVLRNMCLAFSQSAKELRS